VGPRKLNFVGVDAASPLASAAISLHPIDGIGSEVALMAYLAPDRFLWASDYIQTVAEPSAYASEVWSAVRRDGLHPERTAAEHLSLTAVGEDRGVAEKRIRAALAPVSKLNCCADLTARRKLRQVSYG